MKTKDEVKVQGKPVFYAVLYNSFRKAALDCGYALALHGSMQSDMDLIAVAWTEDASTKENLVKAINDCIGETVWKEHNFENFEKKPHGKYSYSLSIMGDWFIDLCIVPPFKIKEAFMKEVLSEYNREEISFSKMVEKLNNDYHE